MKPLAVALSLCAACAAGDGGPMGFPDADPHTPAPRPIDAGPVPDAAHPPPDAMAERCLDSAEPNDSSPYFLGEYNDGDDDEDIFEFNLHAQDDVDLYSVDLRDGTDISNPTLLVSISVPQGDEYTIYADAICDNGLEATSVDCHRGAPAPDGRGCESSPGASSPKEVELTIHCGAGWLGLTDEGTVEFRVAGVGEITTCQPYSMRVRVQ